MANKITAKRKNVGKKVSHANNKTNKIQNLNYQKVTIDGVTFTTTAKEARTLKKNK